MEDTATCPRKIIERRRWLKRAQEETVEVSCDNRPHRRDIQRTRGINAGDDAFNNHATECTESFASDVGSTPKKIRMSEGRAFRAPIRLVPTGLPIDTHVKTEDSLVVVGLTLDRKGKVERQRHRPHCRNNDS